MKYSEYESYKACNFPLINKMPRHWAEQKIKFQIEACIAGGTPDSANERYWEDSGEGVPWVSIADITKTPVIKSTEKDVSKDGIEVKGLRIVPAGTLLYSIFASLGKVAEAGVDLTTNQAILGLVPRGSLENKYFRYWLQSIESFLMYFSSSNTQHNLNAEKVKNLPIFVPCKEEQRAIAYFLDYETAKIDTLIEKQQRLIELLKEKRQAVISHAVTKGLNPDAPMRDSGVEWLGEVPAHWDVSQLKYEAKPGTSITYGIVQAGPHIEGGIPYIKTSDMAGDSLPLEGYSRTSRAIDDSYRRSKVVKGDLVIAIRATVGKCLPVPKELEGANLTQGTAKVSPGKRFISDYLLSYISSTPVQNYFDSMAKGATFREITLDMLRRLPTLVPPLEEQKSIFEEVSSLSSRFSSLISSCEKQEKLLKERRTALISAAVTGKIDVRNWKAPEQKDKGAAA